VYRLKWVLDAKPPAFRADVPIEIVWTALKDVAADAECRDGRSLCSTDDKREISLLSATLIFF
jgi:hypothetical protein